jgi:hypothetical protein
MSEEAFDLYDNFCTRLWKKINDYTYYYFIFRTLYVGAILTAIFIDKPDDIKHRTIFTFIFLTVEGVGMLLGLVHMILLLSSNYNYRIPIAMIELIFIMYAHKQNRDGLVWVFTIRAVFGPHENDKE